MSAEFTTLAERDAATPIPTTLAEVATMLRRAAAQHTAQAQSDRMLERMHREFQHTRNEQNRDAFERMCQDQLALAHHQEFMAGLHASAALIVEAAVRERLEHGRTP